ncbi:MAG: DNA topoisomerase IB, partial [Actinomycetota bacterium]|nr:DNA topoisomerase IB [Actinomycetota bacterium]
EPSLVERLQKLAIPPAWKDVWICPYPMGHIQATGTDAAGRRQYLYHERWRRRRDAEKFDEMLDFARALPILRDRVARDLATGAMTRERVLACAARLLDRGFFRIGSESYAEENDTYGLATVKKRHASIERSRVRFDYEAKGRRKSIQSVVDPEVAEVVDRLKRRRGGIDELLAYKDGRRWRDVKSADINDYVKEVTGGDFSAKDFRTWGATVLAAWFLALPGQTGGGPARKRRMQTRVVKDVARLLGNTPAVCRASYIDPRVFDRHDGGLVIVGAADQLVGAEGGWPEVKPTVEQAVMELIEDPDSPALLENVAEVV